MLLLPLVHHLGLCSLQLKCCFFSCSLPPDWRELHCAQQLVAFLCVPLTQEGGKVVGTLTLASGDGES